jgi:hypothetical protein
MRQSLAALAARTFSCLSHGIPLTVEDTPVRVHEVYNLVNVMHVCSKKGATYKLVRQNTLVVFPNQRRRIVRSVYL